MIPAVTSHSLVTAYDAGSSCGFVDGASCGIRPIGRFGDEGLRLSIGFRLAFHKLLVSICRI